MEFRGGQFSRGQILKALDDAGPRFSGAKIKLLKFVAYEHIIEAEFGRRLPNLATAERFKLIRRLVFPPDS